MPLESGADRGCPVESTEVHGDVALFTGLKMIDSISHSPSSGGVACSYGIR